MLEFKTILIPIDFSEPSRNALAYGVFLADQFNARVIVAHVIPESSGEYRYEEISEEIKHFHRDVTSSRSNIESVLERGDIGAELLEIVSKENVDLVVMGTHGSRNPERWFIGSVTEHMLRKLPVPLVTVSRFDREQGTILSLKRILYATDLSESSSKGMKCAIEIASAADAQLTLMHAVHYPDRIFWAPGGIPGFAEEQGRLSAQMRGHADGVMSEGKIRNLQIETTVVEGKPFEKILEIANHCKTDLIVLNLQSKSTLDRAFLGSTAERVVRLSSIPVLSVPLASTHPVSGAS